MPVRSSNDSLSPESGAYPATFEDSLARLQEIVEQLEDGRLPLAESLAAYEEGVKHLKVCYEALSESERKIELLAGVDAAGNAITRPLDDTATADQEAARRGRAARTPAANASGSPGSAAGPPTSATNELDDRRELF